MPRITLDQVAALVGLHTSSVSLALRDHPRIPVATRERVKAAAAKLGYRPDPVLGALVAYRRTRSARKFAGVLAWLDVWAEAPGARKRFPEQWAGAQTRATALGWKLEEFKFPPANFTPQRASQILRQRNITGVILPPMPTANATVELESENFAAVATSHSLVAPRVHHVTPDQMENLRLCLRTLQARGYRRAALLLSRETNDRTRRYFSAAMLDDHMFGSGLEVPEPLLYAEFPSARELKAWLKRVRADVVVTENPHWLVERLGELGLRVPEDLGVAGTSVWERREFAGIDENYTQLGSAAVDLVTAMIQRNERGLPVTPLDVRVPGFWNEAPTVRTMAIAVAK